MKTFRSIPTSGRGPVVFYLDIDHRVFPLSFQLRMARPEGELTMELCNKSQVRELLKQYGFSAPDMTVTEFVEDELTTVSESWVDVKSQLPFPGEEVELFCQTKFGTYTCHGFYIPDNFSEEDLDLVPYTVKGNVYKIPLIQPKRKNGKERLSKYISTIILSDGNSIEESITRNNRIIYKDKFGRFTKRR